jgi:RNA 3'-terminal phosphate cyclase (ATP)
MQDQLIIFMALAQGHSSMLCGELTLHTRTAISIAEQLMPEVKFDISTLPVADAADADGTVGQPLYLVKCTGAGSVVRGT